MLEDNQIVNDKAFFFKFSDLTHVFKALVGTIRGFFSRKEIYDALAMYLYKNHIILRQMSLVHL